MSLTKANGNMYPWVTHCHSFLRGECPHKCSYCYARDPVRGHPSRQEGPLRMDCQDLHGPGTTYPRGSTVFVEHKNDLWAKEVPDEWIKQVLFLNLDDGCRHVFQSKNPMRFVEWLTTAQPDDVFGTTIETNREIPAALSLAPPTPLRALGIREVGLSHHTFITIEPVMAFDTNDFIAMLVAARPHFINIGADSKRKGLPEPDAQSLQTLIRTLRECGIEVREKKNLARLLGGGAA